MTLRSVKTVVIVAALLWPLLIPAAPAHAQGPCGTVDTLDTPLPADQFRVIYDFGVPSSRYDGRFHAGEDWFGTRAGTYGAPVQAIARGRVTYSAPLGWGLDKGVVIIEHLMPDGTWWYSMYGHMEELDGITFPTVFTCVDAGDVIGAIGRPRPAPHLHFEIRNFGPDSPGPGYWGTDPIYSGWRNPYKFILNWQAWLNPAHRWHADIADTAGPAYPFIVREDNVTVVYDNQRLKALNPNGQVLWRYIIPETLNVVGVMPYEGAVLVADYSGIMQRWALDGGFIDQWQIPTTTNTTAFTWQNLLIVHDSTANALVAYGPERTERWRVPDVARVVRVAHTDTMLGIASIRGALTLVGPDGRVYDRATLQKTPDLAPAPDGGMIVSSQTALWHVSTDGNWQRLADAPTTLIRNNSLFSLPDGRFFLINGSATGRTLHAYAPDGNPLWAAGLRGRSSDPYLLGVDRQIVLADGYGTITLLDAASGQVCNEITFWGSRSAGAWATLGPDNVLRVHIADQVIGLDWATLQAPCLDG